MTSESEILLKVSWFAGGLLPFGCYLSSEGRAGKLSTLLGRGTKKNLAFSAQPQKKKKGGGEKGFSISVHIMVGDLLLGKKSPILEIILL